MMPGTSGTDFIFPTTTMGYSSTAIFTIKNVGDANLSGLALIQSGANLSDYPPSGLTATDLAPNATATFSVNFEPSGEGLRTAAISITSNDADENPFLVRLRGTGTPLQITQQPVDTSADVGGTAQFAVFGGPFARYQWQRKFPGATTFVDVPLNGSLRHQLQLRDRTRERRRSSGRRDAPLRRNCTCDSPAASSLQSEPATRMWS